MYTGVFNSAPWPAEVPVLTDVSYAAPLFVDLDDGAQEFEVSIKVSDAQGIGDIEGAGITLLSSDGYMDEAADQASGSIAIKNIESVPGTDFYTATGYPGRSWPDMDSVTVRFSVKDLDGNVGYADTVVQVAKAGCSTDAAETLEAGDMLGGGDVSCIAGSRIDSMGEVIVMNGVVLYLSAPVVNLNSGFKVQSGGEAIVK